MKAGWQPDQAYILLDAGAGERLEQWADIVCVRPDPQILWPRLHQLPDWDTPHLRYERSSSGGGRWLRLKPVPDRWLLRYGALSFYVKPTDFKHMGLFPEQTENWQWIIRAIQRAAAPVRVLNLFAYTGAATVAAAYAGATVAHVDAARGMVRWAQENLEISGLAAAPVRFITDDVVAFVRRELRRRSRYDAIIMDPPSYGRGTRGQTWKIEKALPALLSDCVALLSPRPLFFLINSYTAGYSPRVFGNLLRQLVLPRCGGSVSCGELSLPIQHTDVALPCGVYGRWLRE